MNQLIPVYHRNFEKQLAKLPDKQRNKAIDAIEAFLIDPTQPSLRVDALKGNWAGHYSL